MGTKNEPGVFDCYANAAPDEPMFILLGRDKFAPSLVDAWADARERDGEDAAKVAEARDCANKMREHLKQSGKQEQSFAGQTVAQGQAAMEDAAGRAGWKVPPAIIG